MIFLFNLKQISKVLPISVRYFNTNTNKITKIITDDNIKKYNKELFGEYNEKNKKNQLDNIDEQIQKLIENFYINKHNNKIDKNNPYNILINIYFNYK